MMLPEVLTQDIDSTGDCNKLNTSEDLHTVHMYVWQRATVCGAHAFTTAMPLQ